MTRCLQLLRGTRAPDAPPREVTIEQLQQTVRGVLPTILDWLASERLPGLTVGDSVQVLSEPQIEYLLDSVAPLGRYTLLATADEWLDGRTAPADRRAVLVLARATADSRDLARLVHLAAPLPDGELDGSLEHAFEQVLRRMFERDLRALPAVIATRSLIPEPLLAAYTRALGGTRDERALLGLRLVWDREPTLESLVLAQVRQLPTPRNGADAEEFASRLRRILDRLDPGPSMRVQSLVFALGQLEDWRSVELLVPLLEHGDRGVREAAHWALRRISGVNFAANSAHWREWCQRELAWYQETSDRLVQQLASGEAKRASLALRELVGHRLFRHPSAVMLEGLLESGDKNARVAACQALAQLGSQRAQRALVQRLEDRDAVVRDAAWLALTALTGRELPRTRLDCLAALFPAAPKS